MPLNRRHTCRPCLCTLLLAAALLMPSCAYMQTNKNVREMGRSYKGYKLDQPQQLYRSGNTWYVAAHPAEYRLSHDLVHDNVFRKTNEPSMTLRNVSPETVYHAIPDTSATILLRPDGYMDTRVLAQELMESGSPWLTTLPHASTRKVQAQFAPGESAAITSTPTPAEVPLGYQALAGLDFLLIDVPGTVVYNVAVPFMIPFVFFYEFLSE